jgi:Zn-dependent peptidase ImmA (M78 family)
METDELDLGPRTKLARALAQKLVKQAGITTAPVSLQRVVEYLQRDRKLIVLKEEMPEKIHGLMVTVQDIESDIVTIGINGIEHWHRRRFTLGHEIGHLLLGHVGCDKNELHHETEANAFSAELLMPKALLKQDFEKTRDIPTLARVYRVSQQSLSYRLMQGRMV